MTQTALKRVDGRAADEIRPYSFQRDFIKTAEGSVLATCGDTKVIVTAKAVKGVPPWLRNENKAQGKTQGWLTSEYAMLPGSSKDRIRRERKGSSGRSAEIQRLIGRSLRAMIDLNKLPELTIHIDCDVIQADGGTRTTSISAAYVAVYDALRYIQNNPAEFIDPPEGETELAADFEIFPNGLPISNQLAAISIGICDGHAITDLNYPEDSSAQADSNFVLTADGQIVEIQGTAEDGPFSPEQFNSMFNLAQKAIKEICELQNQALEI